MNSKDYYKKKNEGLLKYWEPKRENRLKYALLQSLYFAVPFSFIFQALESLKGFLTLQFAFKFISIFCIYFLLTYYITYNMYEKRYQKLKNDPQNFDN
ncbi:hypothetical protein [Polaribacter sp. BM10]|uniref:hypothetical protein n=1 Tax=unclassified Polaribacter TaxID=196858 RepID=UPI00098A00B4|nr:hypothetical protein [Polaribacter sp. BM10]AQS92831.1 hypothetical protein BXQ17_01565 [Polaribacter sp. BM10]